MFVYDILRQLSGVRKKNPSENWLDYAKNASALARSIFYVYDFMSFYLSYDGEIVMHSFKKRC